MSTPTITTKPSCIRFIRGKASWPAVTAPNLLEKPTKRFIRNEADNGLKNRRGTIFMVRQPDVIDSAACQFFINVADNPSLDYKDRTAEGYGYCVFGEVTEGMDAVDAIANTSVQDTPQFERTPVQPLVITSAKRIQ